MQKIILILISVVFLSSCDKSENCKECVTVCEECDCDWPEMEEDILPPVDVPVRENPKVIVLLYHNLVYGRTGNIYNRDIYNFENDLIYIRKNFKVIDFNELDKINNGEMTLTQDAAIITFDDGDLSIHPIAFPLLKKYNLKATFFIVSSYVGETGYVSWDQLREMANYTNPDSERIFTMGSHTATHASLGDISIDEAELELLVSKQAIESELNVDVEYVALPYGSGADDPQIQAKAKQVGYKGLRNSNPKAISNFPIEMYNIPSVNIENYSNDKFVTYVNELLGR
ncbi:polysaccharide deacetylase family protein [Plebeiibacterium marinum]|uniref:Polysaccharide deacetylase family protein n=1 Tax=Plebeiibacterium marinum TaxID=2992111 RepID=A0AAE3MB31_9BACT|nr:polysaccharide deacetylase family protein [Plebeiobacterium marinum]MCW3804177.1 polysaccharide deacetylase family protein [Plebeiobacterium marinum]